MSRHRLHPFLSRITALSAILLTFGPNTGDVYAGERVFRGRNDATCATPLRVDNQGWDKVGAFRKNGAYECMVATYALPGGNGLNVEDSYQLSFLEFGGKPGGPMEPKQLPALNKVLDAPGPKYVLVFVHGWHHNANVDDRDVQRLHVFLAYTRSFLNQRPEHRDKRLIGVYVGWDGAVWASGYKWPGDHLSYGRKKKASDDIAGPIAASLTNIARALELKTGDPKANKMLVIGHSMGGNILMKGLQPEILQQLATYKSGSVMTPPLGDLTVLINPASEARRFVEIQKTIREKGLKFPAKQPPGFISITSTTDWHRNELCSGLEAGQPCLKKPEYDTATGKTFTTGQRFFFGYKDRLDNMALGHLHPEPGFRFGVTHDLTGIKGANYKTLYSNAAIPARSTCSPSQAWLPRLRAEGTEWDTWRKNVAVIDPSNKTEYQLRSRLMRATTDDTRSARINNEPYWNIRALPNLVEGHNGFISYTVMCMLNQMVLDDIGGLGPARMTARH